MKDYTLSEIKKHCKEMQKLDAENFAEVCAICQKRFPELSRFCLMELDNVPATWAIKIDPCDVIELPYKTAVTAIDRQVISWEIVWRSKIGTGAVTTKHFNTEAEADKFMDSIKGEHNE